MTTGILIQVPKWEDEGVLPGEGDRKFLLGKYAKPQHHNALMDRNYKDHELFATLFNKYGTARLLFAQNMITLSGTDTGVPPTPAVLGAFPAWQFAADPPAVGKVEEVFFYTQLANLDGAIHLYWASPDATGKNVVWGVEVSAVQIGASVEQAGTAQSKVCQDAALANYLNHDSIEIGPFGAEDALVAVRVFRDAASASDDPITAYLLAVAGRVV